MTSFTNSRPHRQPARFQRATVLLLLTFILHGVTAEIVHRHGNFQPSPSASGVQTPAISDSGDVGSSLNLARAAGECVICQFHQNLSSTLFSALPGVASASTQFRLALAISLPYHSEATAPRRGRAPPPSFLL